jgi:hypothetical protein
MRLVRVFVLLAGVLASVLICAPSFAQSGAEPAQAPAGTIDLVDGTVQLIQAGKAPRPAAVGDAVYEGDILATGKDSEVHVTMQDSGFIALRSNSRVRLLAYKADGGDDDKGIFRLVAGGMRSITGWIGKFNQKSYLVRTPTATIGVRGTDHEVRYIPPGSDEGEPGTYDKVFAGETSIQTDGGTADVTADHAGYVADNASQVPQVLPGIPGFFRPGPHEELINRKHAEIQQMIEQRREERRKVLEQKRAALDAARRDAQAQTESNRAAAQERAAAVERQRQDTEAQLAVINGRETALQEKQRTVREMRRAIQEKTAAFISRNRGLRERMRVVRETSAAITRGFKDIQDSRKTLNTANQAATEARAAAAEQQSRATEAQLAAIGERWKAWQKSLQAVQDMNQAIQEAATESGNGAALNQRRQASRAAADAADREQRDILQAQSTLFESNMAATEARLAAAREQRRQTAQQLDDMSAREEALRSKQQQNESELEAIQAAVGETAVIDGLREQIGAAHVAAETARNERREIQQLRTALRQRNMAAVEERADATLEQLKALREKRRDVNEKSVDLVNERESMQEEIRSLYAQEQRRYREELQADRLQGALQDAAADQDQGGDQAGPAPSQP